jgi:hypothetical protein
MIPQIGINSNYLVWGNIFTDIIFCPKWAYEDQEKDTRKAQPQWHDFGHGFLYKRHAGQSF